jgi:hypothetical protein
MKRNVSPIESVSSDGESQMAVQQDSRVTVGGSTGHQGQSTVSLSRLLIYRFCSLLCTTVLNEA